MASGLLSTADALAADPSGDAKEVCRVAYEQGQVDRSQGRLQSATQYLRTCSQPACASFMRSDCARWLDEIAATMPSLIVAVHDSAGQDVTNVRLLVDGQVRATHLDGLEFEVDPGPHVVRVELLGAEPVTQEILVRLGERGRRIEMTVGVAAGRGWLRRCRWRQWFPPHERAGCLSSPTSSPGVTVAGLGWFAAFGILGNSVRQDRGNTCAPYCSDQDVAPIRTDYRLADVGLGVAVVAAATATYFFLAHATAPAASSRVGLSWPPAVAGVF